VISERCVSRPDDKSLEKKLGRWNKIALEAAMQSGRGIIPEILPAIEFSHALDEMLKNDFHFICYEDEKDTSLKQLCENANKTKRIYRTHAFFVGPEGGISVKEADLAKEKGIPCISLGKRILRTETAPLCVLSALMYETGNLG
jgi:16S rRNA (uracil1498-N3)-methyltransferase